MEQQKYYYAILYLGCNKYTDRQFRQAVKYASSLRYPNNYEHNEHYRNEDVVLKKFNDKRYLIKLADNFIDIIEIPKDENLKLEKFLNVILCYRYNYIFESKHQLKTNAIGLGNIIGKKPI